MFEGVTVTQSVAHWPEHGCCTPFSLALSQQNHLQYELITAKNAAYQSNFRKDAEENGVN